MTASADRAQTVNSAKVVVCRRQVVPGLWSLTAQDGRVDVMLHIGLWEPEIPPNTGNIARLCAATGATLHLIGRLGFRLDDRSLRRAGLDYWPAVTLRQHDSLEQFLADMLPETPDATARCFCYSARASRPYTDVRYRAGDVLLFGRESSGLPATFLEQRQEQTLTIPLLTTHVRSLNLSTAVGIVVYEALRQLHNW
jgi:tRNA (cytidine/uridine-2'-O-)-methyltransferase